MIKKIIISMAVWFLTQVIIMGIAMAVTGSNNMAMIMGLFGGAVATIIILALIRYYKPSELIKPVPFIVWLASIPLVFCSLFAIDILSSCVDIPDMLGQEFEILASSAWGILAITFFGPVQEEILMRRVVMKSIYDKKKNVWLAILVSAFIFAAIHVNPIQVVFAFPAGVLLGWLYYRTGSLLVPITGHVLNNSFSCVDMKLKLTDSIYGADSTLAQPSVAVTLVACIAIAAVLICWLNVYCRKHADFLPLQPESNDDAQVTENFEITNNK